MISLNIEVIFYFIINWIKNFRRKKLEKMDINKIKWNEWMIYSVILGMLLISCNFLFILYFLCMV